MKVLGEKEALRKEAERKRNWKAGLWYREGDKKLALGLFEEKVSL